MPHFPLEPPTYSGQPSPAFLRPRPPPGSAHHTSSPTPPPGWSAAWLGGGQSAVAAAGIASPTSTPPLCLISLPYSSDSPRDPASFKYAPLASYDPSRLSSPFSGVLSDSDTAYALETPLRSRKSCSTSSSSISWLSPQPRTYRTPRRAPLASSECSATPLASLSSLSWLSASDSVFASESPRDFVIPEWLPEWSDSGVALVSLYSILARSSASYRAPTPLLARAREAEELPYAAKIETLGAAQDVNANRKLSADFKFIDDSESSGSVVLIA